MVLTALCLYLGWAAICVAFFSRWLVCIFMRDGYDISGDKILEAGVGGLAILGGLIWPFIVCAVALYFIALGVGKWAAAPPVSNYSDHPEGD